MVKGKIRVNFLKEGGVTVTMSISEEDAASIDHELMDLRKSEVVLVKADEAVLSRHDEIHEARVSLDVIAGNTKTIRDLLEIAWAKLPLDDGQKAGAGDEGGSSEF